MNKKVIRILIGVLLGGIIAFIGEKSNIPSDIFTIGTIVVLGAVFILSIIYNIIYQKRLNKIMLPTYSLLEEGEVDEFIKVNEELLKTKKNSTIRLKIILFLILGYDKKKDYETPKKLIKEIDYNNLSKRSRVIYKVTLAISNFKSNNIEEGLDIMEIHENEFNNFRNDKELSGLIIYAQILELSNLGMLEKALELIKKSRTKLGEYAFEEEYNLIEEALNLLD